MQMRKLRKAGKVLALSLAAGLILLRANQAIKPVRHNFYRDWRYSYFMNMLGLEQGASGESAIRTLGSPEKIQYRYRGIGKEQKLSYITLQYDGLSLGIPGDGLRARVRRITVERPGVLSLRGGVDIGSDQRRVGRAYRSEQDFAKGETEGEIAFALGTAHMRADWDAVFLFFQLDDNGIVREITVTDGL